MTPGGTLITVSPSCDKPHAAATSAVCWLLPALATLEFAPPLADGPVGVIAGEFGAPSHAAVIRPATATAVAQWKSLFIRITFRAARSAAT